eukprot:TRINITY_DN19623_c0_g1_i1.p1 TRINITY_DN19623_c0_g1~~TRINITY_DN19623_c0_g1_i1.p1  ORF type:complete len:602 (-),score=77.45 TRINITY_DN19623_c0_g1_i1:142-1731(-)
MSLIQQERIQISASHSGPSSLARGLAQSAQGPALTRTSSLQKSLLAIVASQVAGSGDGFVDYDYWLERFGTGFSIVLLVWLLVLLWLLNTTAQDFFVPPLQYWASLLKLSPEISGATLVALGNGAPDIFSMSGARSASHSFNLAFGGMMSVLCITGGAVLYTRQRVEDRAAAQKEVSQPAECLMLDGGHASPNYRSYIIGALWLCAALAYLAYLMKDGDASNVELSILPLLYAGYVGALAWCRVTKPELQPTADTLAGETPPLPGLARPEGANTYELLLWLMAWPTYAIRCVLIPPSDLHWDRSRRVCSAVAPIAICIFCAVTYLGGCGVLVLSAAYICVSLGVLLCSAGIYCCSNDGPAVPKFYPAITLMAKVSSILVLSVIGDELANCARALGKGAGLSSLVLETTAVSWANSMGDLVTGIAMVRQGQSEAAYTVVFAGPLFNCLSSLGFALLFTSERSEGRVDLWETYRIQRDLEVQVGFLGVACVLVAVFFTRERKGASLFLPAVLGGVYIVYLTCLLVLEWHES